MKKIDYSTIDEYIAGFPAEIQEKLNRLRQAIREAAPDAEERISYRMPEFYQNGALAYFGVFKDHVGFFPTGRGMEHFKEVLAGYSCSLSKGTLRLPLDRPFPLELIRQIVQFNLAENLKKKS